MKTIHIMPGVLLESARRRAEELGIFPSRDIMVIPAGDVLSGSLRGLSAEIVVHFDPEREIGDERDRREFMQQVQLSARDGLVIHTRPRPITVGSDATTREQARRRYFTAADGNPPTEKQREAVSRIQDAVIALAVVIEEVSVADRHRDRALEDLEAVAMRAIRGIFAEGGR